MDLVRIRGRRLSAALRALRQSGWETARGTDGWFVAAAQRFPRDRQVRGRRRRSPNPSAAVPCPRFAAHPQGEREDRTGRCRASPSTRRCAAPSRWPPAGSAPPAPTRSSAVSCSTPHGEVVGEGFHAYAGGPHAEIVALAQAGERARGGTAVVTLEPCDHTGRTGPCSQALISAGVARVVIAVDDPNPIAAGGAATLRAAGRRGRHRGAHGRGGGRQHRLAAPPYAAAGRT